MQAFDIPERPSLFLSPKLFMGIHRFFPYINTENQKGA